MTLFVPALWASAGIALAGGLQFLVASLSDHRADGRLPFAVVCLLVAPYMALSALWAGAASAAEAAVIVRAQMALACGVYPAFVLFLVRLTGRRLDGRWFVPVVVGFGGLFLVNAVSSHSLLFTEIRVAAPLTLPWGESVAFFETRSAGTASVWYLATAAVFVWALIVGVQHLRRGERWTAVPLLVYLVAQIGAILFARLTDVLQIRSVYLVDFAFPLLVVLMGAGLAVRTRQHERTLERTVGRLNEETGRRRESEAHLEYLAYHDTLTGLFNRKGLHHALDVLLARCATDGIDGALVLFDLDRFRLINDSLGYAAGDAILRDLAAGLEDMCGPEEAPICPARTGGDQFAVVASGAGDGSVDRQWKRIARLVGEGLHLDGRDIRLTAHAGIAAFGPGSPPRSAEIVRRADMALSVAAAGEPGAVVHYHPDMQARAEERLSLERELRLAVDRGQLRLVYQPQIDRAGRVSGVEALARWHHPVYGNVAPDRFIPLAEESGLIGGLGDWVLGTALDEYAAWQRDCEAVPGEIAVNVSPWQLAAEGFPAHVSELLRTRGVGADRLVLEVTEGVLVSHGSPAIGAISDLRQAGVRVAIDDFGTGYSSLAYLSRLPIDQLKIDRMFVADHADASSHALIEAIVAIARTLRIPVLAEGVDSAEVAATLLEMGCDSLQGYAINRPLEAAELLEWLAHNPVVHLRAPA